MTESTRTREIAASPDEVWAVLADFGALATWAEFIDHSSLATEQPNGIGAARRVQVGRIVLIERAIVWEPATELGYEIDGMPPIVGAVTNTWRIEPSGDGSTVSLTTAVDAGKLPHQRLVAKLVTRRLDDTADKLLAALAAHLEDSP